MSKKSSNEIREELRELHNLHAWLHPSGEVNREQLSNDIETVLESFGLEKNQCVVEKIIQETCDVVTNLQGLDPISPEYMDNSGIVFLNDHYIEIFLDAFVPTRLLRVLM